MKLCLYRFLLLVVMGLFLGQGSIFAQAMLNTKTQVEGLTLYQDWKDSSLYYYLPPPLKLKMEDTGRPSFQFLAMRYTGTACRDDANEARFLSLAQFTIVRPLLDEDRLYQAERSLRYKTGDWITLKPIPLNGISAELVAPVGTNPDGRAQRRRIGGVNLAEQGPSEWEEKTFTLKLDPHEAQLLIENMEKEQLAISFSYTYFADAIKGIDTDFRIRGDSAVAKELEHLQEELLTDQDTTPQAYALYGNSLGILADVNRWPDNLKKIDVNAEGFPSGFPSVELRCYDFADGLRPDLAIKRVSFQAFTLGGQLSRPIQYQFRAADTRTVTQNVKFPVALDMSRGYRYKVTEITEEGEISESNGWMEADFCEGLLDLTTDPGKNPVAHKTLEVEVDRAEMEEKGFAKALFVVKYSFAGQEMSQELSFGEGSYNDFQSMNIAYEKDKGYEVEVVWVNGINDKLQKMSPSFDGYYFLVP